MFRFILRRLLETIPVMLAVATITFPSGTNMDALTIDYSDPTQT